MKKLESSSLPENVEGMFIAIMACNTKWLIVAGYNPRKENASYFLSHISKRLDKVLANYEHFLLFGGF